MTSLLAESTAESMHGVAPLNRGGPLIDFSMTPEAFQRNHFEKEICLMRGAVKELQFAWSDVDELLHRVDPVPPLFTVFKDGSISPERFIDEAHCRIDKAKFYGLLQSGASVVMNQLERTSLAAQRLCHAVSRFAGHTATSNAYLSFGGTGTFGRHWDTHDVFVIQLLGKKRWQVFAPTWRNPLSFQTSAGHEHLCPGEPILDCELESGDVLYVPRGWWHRVIPGNTGSFHLSVGTYAPTAMDFLQWICQVHLSQLESARVGFAIGASNAKSLDAEGIVGKLAAVLRDPHQRAAFERSFRSREQVAGEFDLGSLSYASDDETPVWPDDSTVHLNSAYAIDFQGPHLVVNGKELRLEPLRRTLVSTLSRTEPATLRSLYASVRTASRASIRAALFDLAQYDILTIRRPAVG